VGSGVGDGHSVAKETGDVVGGFEAAKTHVRKEKW
jgi:hypothetical protein